MNALPKIVIHTDRDLTPAGKRRARMITTARGGKRIRWYVAGRIYHQLSVTPDNVTLTQEWLTSLEYLAA